MSTLNSTEIAAIIQGLKDAATAPATDNMPSIPAVLLGNSEVQQLLAAAKVNKLIAPAANKIVGLASFWPMQEGSGTVISDVLNPGVTATIAGAGTPWSAGPQGGLQFSGSNQVQTSVQSNLHRQILNLSTLQEEEQILIFWVFGHPATIVNAPVFWWGLAGNNSVNAAYEGFGIHTFGTNKFLQWRDRAPGSTNFTQTALSNTIINANLPGAGDNNTVSAICLSIRYNALGYYEVDAVKKSLSVASPIGQCDGGRFILPALNNGATGRTRWNSAGMLTWGAIPTTSFGTFSANLPTSHWIKTFGMVRRPVASDGLPVRIVRDLEKNQNVFPASLRS